MSSSNTYRGRFAPSPTGPLHFGSLVAALGSYLDAKHHQGTWLVRMEDLDTPRTVPGAADNILHTLERLGLEWDEAVIYQSRRTAAYDAALQQLQATNAVYRCACTRKEIADSTLHGIDGQIYPGTCRNGVPAGREERAWRARTSNETIEFNDALQGSITQHLESEIGDFVVKRADGLFAYQLAVVVDDAFQKITHVVRGADLLHSTPRQIHLQQLLGLPVPEYLHLPVATNSAGEKLSKQTLAKPVDLKQAPLLLMQALKFLRQNPPAELAREDITTMVQWGIQNWDRSKLNRVMHITHDS
jgi:glutamyl-Q tRNA(Asp) synthetase